MIGKITENFSQFTFEKMLDYLIKHNLVPNRNRKNVSRFEVFYDERKRVVVHFEDGTFYDCLTVYSFKGLIIHEIVKE